MVTTASGPVCPVCPAGPVSPVAPLVPSLASDQANFLVKLLLSTTIGIVRIPLLVVNVVAALTVKLADVLLLLAIDVVKPVI